MAVKALIDIIDGSRGTVYLFDKGARPTVVPLRASEAGGFEASGLPSGVDECVLSLPVSMLDFRLLELPFSDPEKVRETLPFELEGLVLGPVEDLVLDAAVLGPAGAGDRQSVLAVYMKKAALKKVLDGLATLGLDPRAVTSIDLGLAIEAGGGADAIAARLLEAPAFEEDGRLRQAEREATSPAVNLRRGALAYARDIERTRRSLVLTVALALAMLVVFGAATAFKLANARKDLALAEKAVINAYAEMFPGEKPKDSRGLLMKAKARVKEAFDREAAIRGVSALDFMMRLQGTARAGLKVTELSVDRGAIVIRGEASSLSRVEEMKGLLDGFLTGVKITETSKSASGETAFTITARGAGA